MNECQQFIRNEVEKNLSSVSLRDIQRVKEITQFYYMVLLYKEKVPDGEKPFDSFCLTECSTFSKNFFSFWVQAIFVSLYLNYVYRIFDQSKLRNGILIYSSQKKVQDKDL